MGLQRWFRRKQWKLLAWMCIVMVGLQMVMFHADKKRHQDIAGKIAEEVDRLHMEIEHGTKRKRLQALPEKDSKSASFDSNSRPITDRHSAILNDQRNYQRTNKPRVNFAKEHKPKHQKPSFKIFVYDLPVRFNSNLTQCVEQDPCYSLEDSGMGTKLRRSDHITYRNTHSSSLEIILHDKFLQSEYRTFDPSRADAFYIPFYPSLACVCKAYEGIDLRELHMDLWNHLASMPYFSTSGRPLRPHFMTLGTRERDHWSSNCPLLRDANRTNHITFIGVEKEPNNDIRKYFHRQNKPMIIAPYPSFGHFDSNYTKTLSNGNNRAVFPEDIGQTTRDIRIFMAASSRKAHDIRVILKHQMNATSERYFTFSDNVSNEQKFAVWFNTPKCGNNIQLPIMDWMRHSIFCLQPPGDSPTRKSFYDAIMAGCIPVTFRPRKGVVRYPFQEELDYGRFNYNIPLDDVLSGNVNVIERLGQIPNYRIKELQKRLVQVAPYLQYSHPPSAYDTDALTMIINEMKKIAA